jgi:hypothetical protein
MKMVQLTKDAIQFGLFTGEQAAFEDDLADAMVAQDRAMLLGEAPGEPETPGAPETPVPQTVAEQPGDDLEDKTRDELLALAEQRGVYMPSGYVKKEDIIELLRKTP